MDSITSLQEIKKTITKGEINALPLTRYEGKIHLIDTDEKIDEACESLAKEKVLGFDTETRPTFKKGVNYPTALLQLAGTDAVYLFQLLKLQSIQPILDLLASSKLLKVGVAVRDDVKSLKDEYPLEPAGFVDIASITQKAGIVNTGLRSLCGIMLSARISKTAQVSNWAKNELSPSQINYAATDAWVSRQLYVKAEELGFDCQNGQV